MFTCATATAFGADLEAAIAPACAIEMLHCYSLVHDDLPAMDDDELRHGKPSCHVAFGEATAILAGDALQALAFETIVNSEALSPDARVRVLRAITQAVGWGGMAGGQQLDLDSTGQAMSSDELTALHGAKTGALIRASVETGAIIADCDARRIAALGEFADRVGLAFQVIDDVLDATETTEQLGKPAGSDAELDKRTFVALMGVDAARAHAEALLTQALGTLEGLTPTHGLLAELAVLAVRRRS